MKTRTCPQCGVALHPTQSSNAKFCQDLECIKVRARICQAARLKRERAEKAVARLVDACNAAAGQFRMYQILHRQKRTGDGDMKANTNAQFARMGEKAVKKYEENKDVK